VPLLLDGLLHLQDEICSHPDLVSGVEQRRPGGGIVVVGDGGAHTGSGLDRDLVPATHQLGDAGRREGHAVLVVLDLGGYSDPHGSMVNK
jgi:hypothetical protein